MVEPKIAVNHSPSNIQIKDEARCLSNVSLFDAANNRSDQPIIAFASAARPAALLAAADLWETNRYPMGFLGLG